MLITLIINYSCKLQIAEGNISFKKEVDQLGTYFPVR